MRKVSAASAVLPARAGGNMDADAPPPGPGRRAAVPGGGRDFTDNGIAGEQPDLAAVAKRALAAASFNGIPASSTADSVSAASPASGRWPSPCHHRSRP